MFNCATLIEQSQGSTLSIEEAWEFNYKRFLVGLKTNTGIHECSTL